LKYLTDSQRERLENVAPYLSHHVSEELRTTAEMTPV
jgi:hypothetical protein